MLDRTIIEAAGKILLVGYGYMGKKYLELLLKLGFAPESIAVVERNPERQLACSAKHPNVFVFVNLAEVDFACYKTMFTLVNSPEHHRVLEPALKAGILNHFVEKPLVTSAAQLGQFWQWQDMKKVKMGVGYVINFSNALATLFEMMRKLNLIVLEGRGFWGKDRLADTRPSAGDLEDEATHPLGTMLSAVEFNQVISAIGVKATLSDLPFVDVREQMALHRLDSSYPPHPNCTSHVGLQLKTDLLPRLILTAHSSFISYGQKRQVEFSLGDATNLDKITHVALLEFDTNEEDTLQLRRAGSAEPPQRWSFPKDTKLRDQVSAFFNCVAGTARDPRLTDFEQAAMMVKISAAAVQDANRMPLVMR